MKFLLGGRGPAEMPFLDHLEELRWRILWSLLAVTAGSVIGWFVVTRFAVLELLIDPIRPYIDEDRLAYFSPTDPFFVTLKLALTVGFILAFPIVAGQVWAFIAPALHKREKRAIVPALYLGLILFLGGLALAYFVVLPMTFKFMMGFQTGSLRQSIAIGPYMSMVVKVLVGFGVVFELPVVVLVLSALGLVTSKFLASKRRFAIAGSAITAALLTPGDAITITVFMMGPLILLYELSIGIARIMERRRKSSLQDPLPAVVIAVLIAASALALPANAQAQDTTRVKTTREIVQERLRHMGREAPRDTTPADSVQVRLRRLREDSVRLARQAAAPADLPRDSIMQALAQLIGFQATQYKGTAALFNADSGVLTLRATPEEKAVVIQGAQSLAADSLITYNRNTTVACGRGKPVLVGEGTEAPVESAFVCYNTRDKIGTAIGATTQVSEGANWHVTADLYTKERDLYGHHARFTDCNLEVPHYHFSAGSMKVVNGDVMVARNVTLNFGDVPVFWLPFLMQSLKQGRRSGILMPEFSVNDIVRRNSRYNRRVRNVGFYWAASDNLGAQVALDWYANNWTGLEGAFDYNFAEQFLNGGATVRHFWQDGGRRDFTIAANNSWQPSERTDLRANVQYSTSSDFIRRSSFDPRELNRSIDSNGGIQRRFDWGSVNVGVNRRQHLGNNKVDMTLPSLSLNLNPVTLFPSSGEGGWFNNITWTGNGGARFTSADIDPAMDPALTDRTEVTANASTSLNVGRLSLGSSLDYRDAKRDPRLAVGDTADDDFLPAEPGQREQRAGWSANLSFQQRLIGTSTFTPGVSMRREFVRDSLTGQMISSPMRLDLNAALKTDLFGFWPGVGPLERIRHRLSPTFSYSYSPAIKPDSLTAQGRLFRSTSREQNRLSIGLSQTIEGKYEQREEDRQRADSAAAAADTMVTDPDQPRRLPQARIVTLLALNTDAVVYDFVEARDGYGIQTTQISNTVSSDLLRGLQLSFTHDLFRPKPLLPGDTLAPGEKEPREFAPHLSQVSASFSLTGSSWIFRVLGLAPRDEPKAPPATGSQPTPVPEAAQGGPPVNESRAELGLMGTRSRQGAPPPRSPIGSWNASLNYTLYRPRTIEGSNSEQENQMLTANVMFQPTESWNVAWNTGYSFTAGDFTDHVLTLTRAMHDWDAHFDFVKAQNGNFAFQFRVQLRANPDLKFDYEQRDRGNRNTVR